MTAAPPLAAAAAAAAVLGAWEALGALEAAARGGGLRRLLAPLSLAGRAGREPTAPERRRLALLATGVLLAGGALVAGPLAGLALGAAAPALVVRAVAWRRRRWRRELAAAVPHVARALADALAGGHSVRGALGEAARSGALPGAAGAEVAAMAHRLAHGERTDAVLERTRARASDPAWDALVAAVLLQRETGGDLAALLRSLAAAQEEARRTEADARALTAQARATGRLVGGLPLCGLGLAELVDPGAMAALLADPRSRLLLLTAVALGAVAVAVIGRLARVA